MSTFSEPTRDQLKHYVYRLIDPRSGETFYVGRGQNDRVFNHVRRAARLTPNHEDDDLRMDRISKIRGANLEVIHIIHRHGMDQDTAKEVEAALIDVYPGLTNKRGGSGSDFGPAHADQLEALYGAREVEFTPEDRCMVIKTKWATVEDHGCVYEAVRRSWVVSKDRASRANYVLAIIDGICREVFRDLVWERSGKPPSGKRQRYEFTGEAVEDTNTRERFIGRRLPARMRQRGAAAPVFYTYD